MPLQTTPEQRFEKYITSLVCSVGHADRGEPGLRGAPLAKGSTDPRRVLARGLRARLALLARRDPAIPVTAGWEEAAAARPSALPPISAFCFPDFCFS